MVEPWVGFSIAAAFGVLIAVVKERLLRAANQARVAEYGTSDQGHIAQIEALALRVKLLEQALGKQQEAVGNTRDIVQQFAQAAAVDIKMLKAEHRLTKNRVAALTEKWEAFNEKAPRRAITLESTDGQ